MEPLLCLLETLVLTQPIGDEQRGMKEQFPVIQGIATTGREIHFFLRVGLIYHLGLHPIWLIQPVRARIKYIEKLVRNKLTRWPTVLTVRAWVKQTVSTIAIELLDKLTYKRMIKHLEDQR